MAKRLCFFDHVIRNYAYQNGKLSNQLHRDQFEDYETFVKNFKDKETLQPGYRSFLNDTSRSFVFGIALADSTVSLFLRLVIIVTNINFL